MTIKDVKLVEDCFDGSSILRYWFDAAWTAQSIQALRPLGELEYFGDFPRPLFRLQTPDGAQIKGIEGDDNCQVVYPREGRSAIQERIEAQFTEIQAVGGGRTAPPS